MWPGPAIRAIGIVVTLAGLRAEDGRDVLLIVDWAQRGHLASDIRHKLERSMATRATLRPEPG